MSGEILSLAFIEPLEGNDAECETVLKQVGALVEHKQYGRDVLYRDQQNAPGLVLARYWRNAEARQRAHEDPEMHNLWRRASEVCRVTKVYEELTLV